MDHEIGLLLDFWKPHSPSEVAAPYDAMYDDVEIPLLEPALDAEVTDTA